MSTSRVKCLKGLQRENGQHRCTASDGAALYRRTGGR
jgi:hypothetical protein